MYSVRTRVEVGSYRRPEYRQPIKKSESYKISDLEDLGYSLSEALQLTYPLIMRRSIESKYADNGGFITRANVDAIIKKNNFAFEKPLI
jgi:hypothetical protein